MPRYRDRLPQLGTDLFLTDGGIETTLIFHDGLDLPHFAAFDLLRTSAGTESLRAYYRPYAELARTHGTGLVLESATWRASRDWGERLDYPGAALADANRSSIALLEEIRGTLRADPPVVLSGCVGPRGDGYVPGDRMSAEEARRYHAEQIEVFAGTEADMVTAITMNYTAEAIGIATATREAGLPVAISFTVETDGRLPTGESLAEAIRAVDAATDGYPAYYMINCAHPSHFADALDESEDWPKRIRGLRANASRMSHAELDAAPELDTGDPDEFGREHGELKSRFPNLTVFGGCCGTDHRHVGRIAEAVGGVA